MKQIILDVKNVISRNPLDLAVKVAEMISTGWEYFGGDRGETAVKTEWSDGVTVYTACLVRYGKIKKVESKSERKIVKYAAVETLDASDLEECVTDRMKKGWELHGGIYHSLDKDGDNLYVQTMVKYDSEN